MAQQPHVADRLDALVYRAHVLSFDLREQARYLAASVLTRGRTRTARPAPRQDSAAETRLAHRRSLIAAKRRSRPTRRIRRSAPSYYGGGSCPCSGSNICIGPRGGRYCITSGGNKRYGV